MHCTHKTKSVLKCTHLPNSHVHTARSDRYSHDFVSDEEGGDDAKFQQVFENFSSTAPRYSHMLDELMQLSFDENDPLLRKKLELAKHEKRDSGISGLEDSGSDSIKILEENKTELLSPSEAEVCISGGLPEQQGGEEEETVVTKIDEVCMCLSVSLNLKSPPPIIRVLDLVAKVFHSISTE